MSSGPQPTGREGGPPDGLDLGPLLEGHRPRLQRMVSLRLDPLVRRRVDSSDVIQETFVEVARRYEEYRAKPRLSFYLWVRLTALQKLADVHRQHLGAGKRDVRRELLPGAHAPATSASLAWAIVDRSLTPSRALQREELQRQLMEALEGLKAMDREILMLRHFEQLSNEECAEALGLTPSGAKLRHMRAAKRLREVLRAYPDLAGGLDASHGGRIA